MVVGLAALSSFASGCGRAGPETGNVAARPDASPSMAAQGMVTMPGQLEAAEPVWVARVTQGWRRTGDTIERIVPEGTRVKKGDFLLQMDLTPMEREEEKAQAAVEEAELAITSAEAEVGALTAQLRALKETSEARRAPYRLAVERLKGLPDPVELSEAESELVGAQEVLSERTSRCAAAESLARQHLSAEPRFTQARLARQIAAAVVSRATARLDGVRRGAGPHEVEIAEIEAQIARIGVEMETADLEIQVAEAKADLESRKAVLAQARKALDVARKEVALGTRHAPRDGVVVYGKTYGGNGREKVKPGAYIGWSTRIAAVISGRDFRFRAKASEALLGLVQAGQSARIHLDALPDAVLEGRVESIDVSLEPETDESQSLAGLERTRPKTFDVLVAVRDVPDGLMPGLSGRADVEVQARGRASSSHRGPAAGRQGPRGRGHLEGRPGLRLPGYVDVTERSVLVPLTGAQGQVTKVLPQYSRVEQGDVLLETTGDRGLAMLMQVEDAPRFAEARLQLARQAAETADRRHRLEVERALLGVKAAEARIGQLESLPHESSVRMAEAEVRRAELEMEAATALLEVVGEAGMASEAEVEARQLDVGLGEQAVAEAKVRLRRVLAGAPPARIAEARMALEQARQEVPLLSSRKAQSEKSHEADIAVREIELAAARGKARACQEQYEGRAMRSPAAGNVVFDPRPRFLGGPVAVGDTLPAATICLGYVADLSKLKFCAVVEEPYVRHVKLGGKARVELVAFPGRSFEGSVSAIVPLIVDREEVRAPQGTAGRFSNVPSTRVDIRLEVPEGAEHLILPGMTGTARLLGPEDEG